MPSSASDLQVVVVRVVDGVGGSRGLELVHAVFVRAQAAAGPAVGRDHVERIGPDLDAHILRDLLGGGEIGKSQHQLARGKSTPGSAAGWRSEPARASGGGAAG